MNPKISIIIPVYNAEKYVGACIESLLAQSFADFECILVNDGSTDGSSAVCREYARKDPRVIHIDQENQGVCGARNTGLDAARGETITFVDSDDWMDENGLEILYNEYLRTGADLIVADMSFAEGDKRTRIRVFDESFTTDDKDWISEYERACIGYGYNPRPGTKMNITGLGSMGNKLYRREIIERDGLRFDPYTLGIYEDNLFVLNYLERTNKVSYVAQSIYYYRKVADSNSRGYKARTLEINDRIFRRINEFIDTYKADRAEDFRKALYIYIMRRLDVSLMVYFFADKNNKSFRDSLRELNRLIRREPYKTAIKNVDPGRLNPKNHRVTWATARTGSALAMWLGFEARMITRKAVVR